MQKGEKLYEGKAKIIYKTVNPDIYVQYFKDDATAFDGVKKGQITGKGVANNLISSRLFALLEKSGVPTHFVEKLSDNEMAVKSVQIVPVELVIRNVSTGSLCRRYGVKEGIAFGQSIVELYYKNDELHDPLMNEDHIIAFKLATREELAQMREMGLKINEILRAFFDTIGITLVDFKLEFGRHKGQIILADEISPDTCRFWEKGSNRKLDKDRFRFDLGDVEDTYLEMMKKVTEA